MRKSLRHQWCFILYPWFPLMLSGLVLAADSTDGNDKLHTEHTPLSYVINVNNITLPVYSTADATFSHWIDNYLPVELSGANLTSTSAIQISDKRAIVLTRKQLINGLPVEGGFVKSWIRNGAVHRLTYVGGRLFEPPRKGFAVDRISSEDAISVIQLQEKYQTLSAWSNPTLVVLYPSQPANNDPPIRAWKFTGVNPLLSNYLAFTFFVDAATGKIARVRNEVFNAAVTGSINGRATPGMLPDSFGNPPLATELPSIVVGVPNGPSTVTDSTGQFIIDLPAGQTALIEAGLSGPWVIISSAQSPALSSSTSIIPPTTLGIIFNSSPTQLATSQVNAFVHITGIHDFVKSFQPGFTSIDMPIECRVNIVDACNAFFSAADSSLNFFHASSGCPNTAYSSVIVHEYGHLLMNRLGLAEGTFGEGFSDSLAALYFDDPVIGRDFLGPGVALRDIEAANRQFPCSSSIHTCGLVLAGIWWDLKKNLQASLGSSLGQEATAQLFTDWAMITAGELSGNSAHPQTAVEVLIVDDDNGNLNDGTPHFLDICLAFAAHSISCPSDCNRNGIIDQTDIAIGTSNDCDNNNVPDECELDCNNNGQLDQCDISTSVSMDCNSNSVPDECEQDCNGNSIADDCDIANEASTDCDLNGIPDECQPDCNSNGIADACDIFATFSEDCSSNGVPDECEPDCNNTGTADSCDIFAGLSTDCNNNATPDECEISFNTDCNLNSILDECDLSSLGSLDCNLNSIPDECDISSGSSVDCDNNGLPDECDSDCNGDGVPDACVLASCAGDLACEDCNSNGTPDGCDLNLGISSDCNNNGLPDDCDISAGSSDDCNGNALPDECEPDCDADGILDDCEISQCSSGQVSCADCNNNSIPDGCEIVKDFSIDCNGNGRPDSCDLADSSSGDCNSNSVPDECERDCDGNGTPDDCAIANCPAGDDLCQDMNLNGVPDGCEMRDPGFEQGGLNWLKIGNGGRSVVPVNSHSGSLSLQMLANAMNPREVLQDVLIVAGENYEVSIWVQTANLETADVLLSVIWLDDKNLPLDLGSHVIREDLVGTITGTNFWTLLISQVTAPAGSVTARVRLAMNEEPDNEGTAWLDDGLFCSLALGTGCMATGDLKLSNPGFELGSAAWLKANNSGRSVDMSNPHVGTSSLHVTTHQQFDREVYQNVLIEQGLNYHAEVWANTIDVSGTGATATLIWLDAIGLPNDLEGHIIVTDILGSLVATNSWTLLEGDFVAPAQAVVARLRLHVDVDSDGSGSTWFDDAQLCRTPPGGNCNLDGDIDGSGDVNLQDYAAFIGCAQGPANTAPPGCTTGDFSGDGSVDLRDVASLLASFTGGP